MGEKYYEWYENRYKTVYEAGGDRWGHSPEDIELAKTLTKWVKDNNLQGKKIIEFACGEGASGVILSKLGCAYLGVDISPSAIQKAKSILKDFTQAEVKVLNIVEEQISDTFDAALDVMGIHMLVTDDDRNKYLSNLSAVLKNGAPVLFYKENYRANTYEGFIDNIEQWIEINKIDCVTPEKRTAISGDKKVDVYVPILPARPRNKEQYQKELESHKLIIDSFIINGESNEIQFSANIFAYKKT